MKLTKIKCCSTCTCTLYARAKDWWFYKWNFKTSFIELLMLNHVLKIGVNFGLVYIVVNKCITYKLIPEKYLLIHWKAHWFSVEFPGVWFTLIYPSENYCLASSPWELLLGKHLRDMIRQEATSSAGPRLFTSCLWQQGLLPSEIPGDFALTVFVFLKHCISDFHYASRIWYTIDWSISLVCFDLQ